MLAPLFLLFAVLPAWALVQTVFRTRRPALKWWLGLTLTFGLFFLLFGAFFGYILRDGLFSDAPPSEGRDALVKWLHNFTPALLFAAISFLAGFLADWLFHKKPKA